MRQFIYKFFEVFTKTQTGGFFSTKYIHMPNYKSFPSFKKNPHKEQGHFKAKFAELSVYIKNYQK